jgi:hypothetical protein
MLIYLVLFSLTLWMIGVVSGNSFDGYIHLLLFVVLVAVTIRYFADKKLID